MYAKLFLKFSRLSSFKKSFDNVVNNFCESFYEKNYGFYLLNFLSF